MRRKVAQTRWWPGAVALGLAVLVPTSLGTRWLSHGGLAPLAVAAVVALLLAPGLARVEASAAARLADPGQPGPPPADRMTSALSEVLALLLIGAIAAPLVASAGLPGQSMALGGWIGVGLLTRRLGAVPAVVLALGAVVLGVGSGVAVAASDPPWTLLEPHWASWREWLPGALAVGLLMAPAGLGQWATGPRVPPGGARVAWATAGVALLVAVGSAARSGGRFEAALGMPGPDPLEQGALGLAVGAAACAVVCRGGVHARWTRVGLGVLGTLWFTGPAANALPAFLGWVVPLGLAAVLGRLAWSASGGDRILAGAGTLVAAAAAVGAPVALPGTVGGAAALGLTVVGMFWYVATRTVGER